jgi:hypothetical protein
MVGYLGKELAKLPFKATAEHFSGGPAVISKGVRVPHKKQETNTDDLVRSRKSPLFVIPANP